MFFACYFIYPPIKHVVKTTFQMGVHAMKMTQALLKKHRKPAFYFASVIVAYLLAWTPHAVVSLRTVLGTMFQHLKIPLS